MTAILDATFRSGQKIGAERITLLAIAHLADDKTLHATVTTQALADMTGRHRSTVAKDISALEAAGRLSVVETGAKARPAVYRLAWPQDVERHEPQAPNVHSPNLTADEIHIARQPDTPTEPDKSPTQVVHDNPMFPPAGTPVGDILRACHATPDAMRPLYWHQTAHRLDVTALMRATGCATPRDLVAEIHRLRIRAPETLHRIIQLEPIIKRARRGVVV